jgi:predicted nucleic acid-binding protein
MSLVIDSSVALSWVYTDEFSAATRRLLEHVSLSGAWVPMVWYLEIANSLQVSVRRRRIDRTTRDAAISDLSALNISTDPETIVFAWTTTLELTERFRLTAYDACYIELALRRGLPLATFDEELRVAGRQLDIELLDL